MHMCVQGCHILRFLKKNMPSHVGDQYVARMQKGIKIGPVVLHIFLGIYGVKPEICICVQRFHIFQIFEKNTPSHVRDQYVVRMQKGIKIGPVVWPLTRSFSHSYTYFVQRFHIVCVFSNFVLVEPSQYQNAILCQKASKSVSK